MPRKPRQRKELPKPSDVTIENDMVSVIVRNAAREPEGLTHATYSLTNRTHRVVSDAARALEVTASDVVEAGALSMLKQYGLDGTARKDRPAKEGRELRDSEDTEEGTKGKRAAAKRKPSKSAAGRRFNAGGLVDLS